MSAPENINLLVLIFVHGRQADELTRRLGEDRFYCTRVDSQGLLLQEPAVCLLIGLNDDRMARLRALVEEVCPPRQEYIPMQIGLPAGLMPVIEAQVGGALLYALPVERFIQF
jgi:uncharacterized protein YaaQ